MNKLKIMLGAALIGGCAQNSGVINYGDNQYMVSRQAATGFSGMGNLKAEALQEAMVQCKKESKEVQVTKEIDAKPPYIFGNFPRTELHFKCVDSTN